MEEILAAIERARGEGGTVLAGGERADDDGYLIAPTVFEGLADDAELSCEEVFGPVTSLYRFATLDEAIERANAVRFGLSASIFTRDLHAVQRFSEEIGAGIIHVNSQTAGADVHVPFGGVKGSGWGPHEQGRAAIEFYTEHRHRLPGRAACLNGTLVTGALGCVGAWTVKALLDEGEDPVGYDLGERRRRLRLDARRGRARARDARAGRRHRRRSARSRPRRARDHACRPPRRAAGAVLPRGPVLGARVNVARNGRRVRGGEGAARPDPGPRLRELDRRLHRRDPSPAPESGGTQPDDALRRLQARQRGHGADLLGRTRASRRSGSGRTSSTARAGPGHDVGPVARDGRRRARRGASRSATAARRSTTSRPTSASRSREPPPRRREGAHVANFPGGRPRARRSPPRSRRPCRRSRAGSRGRTTALPFPERLEAALLERLVGPLPRTSLADGVRRTIEHYRGE